MAENSEEKIAAVVRRVLGLEDSVPAGELTRAARPEWDSLRHVKVMIELQKELGARFTAGEIVEAGSVAAIARLLAEKRG